MKLGEVFTSNYLTHADLNRQDVSVTIKSVEAKEFDDDKKGKDMKLIIGFRELDKSLVCNKTNANTISDIYGDETDEWPGKRIVLYETEVEFGGKTTLAIRVRLRPPGAADPVTPINNLPGPGPLDPLKTAKTRAWHEYMRLFPHAGNAQAVAIAIRGICGNVFGKAPEHLATAEWNELTKNGFRNPADAVLGGDEAGFDPDDIPFQ